MRFAKYLESKNVDKELVEVLYGLVDAIKDISYSMHIEDSDKAGGETNVFGEEQIVLDVMADQILHRRMEENPLVGLVASEEGDGEEKVGDGPYAVCYDPLDGSSLVDVNLSVGTIAGVYKRDTFIGAKGNEQLAAIAAVYGPTTTLLLTFGQGVVQFILDESGYFVLRGEGYEVGEGKMFAPGNLRACSSREDYMDLVNYWIKEQYTLRYSGGMVPDVTQIIIKGKGIFAYPGYGEYPDGKLRLLFECVPLAFLMEQAGGDASDGKIKILDKEVADVAQRTPIFIGSKREVERCEEYL